MLLLGTAHHLEDLDRQYTIAEDVSVTAIACSGTGPAEPYVLLDGRRVARVDEYELAPVTNVELGNAQSLAVVDGGLLVGIEDARLARFDLVDGRLAPLASFDDVPGRSSWENPAGARPDLRSIAVTDAGTWLVNVHVGGVWRSADGGGTWACVVQPEDDVHEVVRGGQGLAAAAARGFGWSVDDGATWRWTTAGLHASYCRAVALDGEVAYVSASTGPSSTDGRLFRSSVGGAFEPCRGGLPESFPYNLDTGTLDAHDGVVALGTPDGRVWRSGDGGAAFETVTERVGRVRVLRFV